MLWVVKVYSTFILHIKPITEYPHPTYHLMFNAVRSVNALTFVSQSPLPTSIPSTVFFSFLLFSLILDLVSPNMKASFFHAAPSTKHSFASLPMKKA